MHPRKVRGGVRLGDRDGTLPQHWATQRWLRLLESAAPSGNLAEALEYAKLGQTRRLSLEPGKVLGVVQGRLRAGYAASIAIARIDESAWDRVVASMTEQALYSAKLLAGELPPTIEDVFAPFGLHLFPAEAELSASCTCARGKQQSGAWCKHVLCLGLLVADELARRPFLVFALRGLEPELLLEKLRQRRQLTAGGGEAIAVYAPAFGGESTPEPDARFWHAGPELDTIEMPLQKPEAGHVLLRRLGPSPFERARFPMVGLLATCYDVIAEAAARDDEPSDSSAGLGQPESPASPITAEPVPASNPAAPAASTAGPVRARRIVPLGKAAPIRKDDLRADER